jgi:hypothetical protein
MGRYRKIDTRIWNDAKFCSLSERGKLVFLFVLTHPHLTSLGAMRATRSGLASELQWPLEAFGEAFGEALRKGLLEYDERASFLGVPNFLRYNGPESPNVVKSWGDALDLIPECKMKELLVNRVKGFVEGLTQAFAKALPEAFAKGMPYPEPEQEQEPEQDSPPTPSTPKQPVSQKPSPSFEDGGGGDDGSRDARRAGSLLIPIPQRLDTPEFRAAWDRWKAHMVTLTSGRLSHPKMAADLEKLVQWGVRGAISAIDFTITKGNWRDLELPGSGKSPPAVAHKPMTAKERDAERRRESEEADRRRQGAQA